MTNRLLFLFLCAPINTANIVFLVETLFFIHSRKYCFMDSMANKSLAHYLWMIQTHLWTRGRGLMPSPIVHESPSLVCPVFFDVCTVNPALPVLLRQLVLNHCWIMRLKYKPPRWLLVWVLSHWQTFLRCLMHFLRSQSGIVSIPKKVTSRPPVSQLLLQHMPSYATLRCKSFCDEGHSGDIFVFSQRLIQFHGCPYVPL